MPAESFQMQSFPKAWNARSTQAAPALMLTAMSLGYGVVQLDVTIVNTALDAMGKTLGGGVAELQWVVSAYTIAFAAFILTAGALGDRIGAKRVFMAGFAIFTAASLGCALSPNAVVLVSARLVQGLAAAILVPNSLALLNHAYADDRERGRAVAVWAAGRESGADRRSVRRRRPDHPGRVARDLSGQSSDRPGRAVVELAICERDDARALARDRSARPARGDRRAWGARGRDHRGGRAWLAASARALGLRGVCRAGRAVRLAGKPHGPADAALVAVRSPAVYPHHASSDFWSTSRSTA